MGAACLLLGVLTAPPANAAHFGGSCPVGDTSYASSASCTLYVRGLPTSVYGTGKTTAGGSVHVWIDFTAIDGVTTVPLLECRNATGSRACESELGVGSPLDSTKQLVLVTCHVQGTGGTYTCSSGLGI